MAPTVNDRTAVLSRDGWEWLYDNGVVLPRMAGGETPPAPAPVTEPPQDPPQNDPVDPPEDPPENEAVTKAYAKLREAEGRERKLKADLDKSQRKDMDENERLKAELEDARMESAGLSERLDEIDREKTVSAVATRLKFRNPALAARLVSKDAGDDKAIEAELKAILKDSPELAARTTPPPPVNDGGGAGNTGSTSGRMNDLIRRSAGRAPAGS